MNLIKISINKINISNNFKLNNINFNISENSICSLIGNNGAGKSSLLNLIIKNHKIPNNNIWINDEDLNHISYKKLSLKISFVPQINNVYEELLVYDFVAMGRIPHTNTFGILKKEDKQVIDEVFHILNIEKFKNNYFGSLSGGERQKVIIANALVQQTPIIIMDEPLTYLDLKAKDEIIDIIKDLKNKYKKTIIMAIHELEIAANISDQIVIFYNGTTPVSGKPLEVITDINLLNYLGVKRKVSVENKQIKINID